MRDAKLGDLRTLADDSSTYDELHRATMDLFDLLDERGVDYVLVGGLALLRYVPGRNTRDIDVIVAPADLDVLPELEVISRDKDFARASFLGILLDLRLSSNPAFNLARERFSTLQPFQGRDIRCATPEGLVLMKLFALPSLYRQGDFGRVILYEGDIQWLIQETGVDPEPLIGLLEQEMLATDIAQIRAIASEILEKIARFGRPE